MEPTAKPAEPDDPMELCGVGVPADQEAVRDMAYVFAEEFARSGLDEAAILELFRNPFYGGAHQAYRALGAEVVQGIVDECVAVWGRAVGRIYEPPGSDAQLLPWPTFSAPKPIDADEMPSMGRRGE